MAAAMIYTGLVDDRAARRRAGLPAAARQQLARLLAVPQQAAARSRAEQVQREAEHVRVMAFHIRESDPGFAADLCAAADRHEAEYGG